MVPDVMCNIDQANKPVGTVATVLNDSKGVYQSAWGDEHDGLDEDGVYIEIGED